MVRVVGEPAQELGLGQIIGQALGLTGIILVLSLLMGLVVGGSSSGCACAAPAPGATGKPAIRSASVSSRQYVRRQPPSLQPSTHSDPVLIAVGC